ncbi:MAG: GNAT family N-acetyltransferase [Planctomycetaceae bacterium]|nr:GNAT family N-acetyltransferase [Planctomycetaceae bacterium]
MTPATSRMLESYRVRLRQWRPEDRPRLAELNADPRVMEFFPSVMTAEESDAMFERIELHFRQHNFGYWAVELPGVSEFAGFVGLAVPRFEAHFTPCVEIGWRLGFGFWGKGYATEAARLALRYAFTSLNLQEVVSMTAVINQRSRRVMEKLKMIRDAVDDFDHPLVPENHRLRRHVLYRLKGENQP